MPCLIVAVVTLKHTSVNCMNVQFVQIKAARLICLVVASSLIAGEPSYRCPGRMKSFLVNFEGVRLLRPVVASDFTTDVPYNANIMSILFMIFEVI